MQPNLGHQAVQRGHLIHEDSSRAQLQFGLPALQCPDRPAVERGCIGEWQSLELHSAAQGFVLPSKLRPSTQKAGGDIDRAGHHPGPARPRSHVRDNGQRPVPDPTRNAWQPGISQQPRCTGVTQRDRPSPATGRIQHRLRLDPEVADGRRDLDLQCAGRAGRCERDRKWAGQKRPRRVPPGQIGLGKPQKRGSGGAYIVGLQLRPAFQQAGRLRPCRRQHAGRLRAQPGHRPLEPPQGEPPGRPLRIGSEPGDRQAAPLGFCRVDLHIGIATGTGRAQGQPRVERQPAERERQRQRRAWLG